MITVQAFLPNRSKSAAIIGVSAGMVNLPTSELVKRGSSAYVSSKMAQLKFLEVLEAENPDIFVVSVHPGVVRTAMLDQTEAVGLPEDDGGFPSPMTI